MRRAGGAGGLLLRGPSPSPWSSMHPQQQLQRGLAVVAPAGGKKGGGGKAAADKKKDDGASSWQGAPLSLSLPRPTRGSLMPPH